MSKIVRLENNVVVEIIPEYATPVERWYGNEFALNCVEAPDEVEQTWAYDSISKKFYEPEPEPVEEQPDTVSARLDNMEQTLDIIMGVSK